MLNGNGSKAGAPATAAGWTGAVSRRPRSAKSPTKNVAPPRGGTLSKSTSKADPPALARSLTNSGKLLHGAKAKIDLLNETVAEVIPDYVPTPERLLKPQRQIPIGKTATKALRRELSKCNKPVAVTGPVDKRKVVRVLSESDAKRVHRQQADRTFRDWKAKKASTQVAERARRVKARKKKADEKAKTKASRAGAYEKWVERKQREAQKSTKKHRKRSVHTGGIAIDEFIASVRRNRYQPELLPLFEELLGVLDKERSGRVNRTAFHELLNQVALQDKIDARKEDIELDREANPLPEKTQDWTPEQRTALQKEKQQQRIGEKIMLHGATGIKALSALMKRVNRTFRMADEGLTGTLKDDALKACFKGLNLGISATDQIEIVKIMRGDTVGERVPYEGFADFMVTCEARRQLEPDVTVKRSADFKLTAQLCQFNGVADGRDMFEACYDDAGEFRKGVNAHKCGWLDLRHFRLELQHVSDGLPMAKRKDVLKAIDTYCKQIDRDEDGEVELSRVDLFLRKIEIEIVRKAAREDIAPEIRRRQEIKFRYWKVAIHNAVNRAFSFDRMVATVQDAMDEFDADRGRPTLSVPEFTLALKSAGCGLSAVQIEELARVYRIESGGRGVCRADVLADLVAAKAHAEDHAARKADKRIRLAADILRSVGALVPQLEHALKEYHTVLMTWDAPRSSMTEAQRMELLGEVMAEDAAAASASVVHTQSAAPKLLEFAAIDDGSGSDFEVSWGHDNATGKPIQMPPGGVPQNEHITLVGMDR